MYVKHIFDTQRSYLSKKNFSGDTPDLFQIRKYPGSGREYLETGVSASFMNWLGVGSSRGYLKTNLDKHG